MVYKKRYESLITEINTENINSSNQKQENDGKYLAEETVQKILEELKHFESNQKFLNNNISLNKLSKSLNTNSSYLSSNKSS